LTADRRELGGCAQDEEFAELNAVCTELAAEFV
jgi:hypothetical protein